MATYTPGVLTTTPQGSWGGVSVDNVRRKFGIGDYVAELSPEQNIFFTYLSKVAKSPTDDTVWKPLEYRSQWQRRNFRVVTADSNNHATTHAGTGTDPLTAAAVDVKCNYDGKGKLNADDSVWDQTPIFLLANQVIRIKCSFSGATNTPNSGTVYKNFRIATVNGTIAGGNITLDLVSVERWTSVELAAQIGTMEIDKDGEGQVVGSQFGEATTAPDGWRDEISATEFYTQIFKTSVPLMSGSAMATKYRGYADEWKRIYAQHVLSHKMDIEHAVLFGHGKYVDQDDRFSWGVVPFIETQGGKIYEMSYNSSGYDALVDIMENFFAPEMGNSSSKLCLTSRNVIAWLSKIGSATSGSFMYNTYGKGMATSGSVASPDTNPYAVQISASQSKFAPVPITVVQTCFGTFNFVAHPLFRGMAANTCAVIDMANIKYRPLSANGLSRDTFVETNIQDNSVDGRKDQIITEAGLEISLPETHALINFS